MFWKISEYKLDLGTEYSLSTEMQTSHQFCSPFMSKFFFRCKCSLYWILYDHMSVKRFNGCEEGIRAEQFDQHMS